MRHNTYLGDDLHKTTCFFCTNMTLFKQYIMWHLFVKVKGKAPYYKPTAVQENCKGKAVTIKCNITDGSH